MGATASFSDKDQGWDALYKRFMAASKHPVVLSVGIHEEDDELYEDGESVCDVAEAHEFGIGVPRRSWLSDWADENEERNKRLVSQMSDAIVRGKVDIEDAMDRLGLKFVGDIQRRIRKGIPPENAPSTIERKGSDTPLIDTGQFWSSIRHHVLVLGP